MNRGGSGGGQNRPWQGGGNGLGHPNPNYKGNNYNPYYNNNSNWNRGYNNWRPTNYQQKSTNQQAVSDPGQAGQVGNQTGGSDVSGSNPPTPVVSITVNSPPAPVVVNKDSGGNSGQVGSGSVKKLFCQRCTSVEHSTQNCKVKMVCDICGKNTHVTAACVWPSQPKPIIQLVGFAAKGLGCFYAQSTKKSSGGGLANTMGLIQFKKGKVSKTELEAALKKSFQGDWEWSAKEIDSGRFVVNFPNTETLSRVLDFEEFTLKGSGLAISVARWSAATLAKAKLFSVWVKIGGFLMICCITKGFVKLPLLWGWYR
jgi:hypothetical protein